MEVDVEHGDCILTPESVCQETGRQNLHQKKVWRYTMTDGESGHCFDEDVSRNCKTVHLNCIHCACSRCIVMYRIGLFGWWHLLWDKRYYVASLYISSVCPILYYFICHTCLHDIQKWLNDMLKSFMDHYYTTSQYYYFVLCSIWFYCILCNTFTTLDNIIVHHIIFHHFMAGTIMKCNIIRLSMIVPY